MLRCQFVQINVEAQWNSNSNQHQNLSSKDSKIHWK